MKENPIQKLSDQELARQRRKFMMMGLIPAVVFCLLELYVIWYQPGSWLEWVALLGILVSIYFVFQAGKYSQEYHRRKNRR